MNLFRSEEHVRRWADYDAGSADGIKPVRELAQALATPLMTERLKGDYVRRAQERVSAFLAALDRLGGGSSFWQMPPPPG